MAPPGGLPGNARRSLLSQHGRDPRVATSLPRSSRPTSRVHLPESASAPRPPPRPSAHSQWPNPRAPGPLVGANLSKWKRVPRSPLPGPPVNLVCLPVDACAFLFRPSLTYRSHAPVSFFNLAPAAPTCSLDQLRPSSLPVDHPNPADHLVSAAAPLPSRSRIPRSPGSHRVVAQSAESAPEPR